MKISDDLTRKALDVFRSTDDFVLECMRAALLAILPDIEREIREECAVAAEKMKNYIHGYEMSWGGEDLGFEKGWDYACEDVAKRIRALRPSTQEKGE